MSDLEQIMTTDRRSKSEQIAHLEGRIAELEKSNEVAHACVKSISGSADVVNDRLTRRLTDAEAKAGKLAGELNRADQLIKSLEQSLQIERARVERFITEGTVPS